MVVQSKVISERPKKSPKFFTIKSKKQKKIIDFNFDIECRIKSKIPNIKSGFITNHFQGINTFKYIID